MDLYKLLYIFLVTAAIIVTLFGRPITSEQVFAADKDASRFHHHAPARSSEGSYGFVPAARFGTQSGGRFLVHRPRSTITCDKYPRVCDVNGSPGPDCCRKKCVNVMADRQNCGKCGRKCMYSEICCEGWCVNPSFNQRHCGHCTNKCNKGSSCV